MNDMLCCCSIPFCPNSNPCGLAPPKLAPAPFCIDCIDSTWPALWLPFDKDEKIDFSTVTARKKRFPLLTSLPRPYLMRSCSNLRKKRYTENLIYYTIPNFSKLPVLRFILRKFAGHALAALPTLKVWSGDF